ncbi:MAG TPA: capsular biosynthesis protein [Caulobacteraceae bacterium]|jgi:capsular polysaccharide export protein|nr:capsular biosynthesis protein [Caulobacteraceae bacterium]
MTSEPFGVNAFTAVSEALQPIELSAPRGAARAVPRHFLFVTAPFGPFARELAAGLRDGGVRCSRLLLSGGDLGDWGPAHAIGYFGGRRGFAPWLARALRDHEVTDVIVHGDGSFYSGVGLAAAEAAGARRHVFEEGYFRPDWITLERNGVNRNSSLPRDPIAYLAAAPGLPERRATPLGRVTPPAVWRIIAHHLWLYLLWPLFPGYRPPYSTGVLRQAVGHTRRYLRQRLARGTSPRPPTVEGPAFLVLLQRPGDSQLAGHAGAEGLAPFIAHVIASFGRCAPPETRLIFKAHPLDPGLEDHAASIVRAARAHGAEGRVGYVDEGRLCDLLHSATGVITVNSTGGLAALEAGRPTLALGPAIYDLPGLTAQDGLDAFWRAAEAPEPALFAAFRRVVMATTQINGAFAQPLGRRLAVREAARRLLASG